MQTSALIGARNFGLFKFMIYARTRGGGWARADFCRKGGRPEKGQFLAILHRRL